jgi:hypothetical protein
MPVAIRVNLLKSRRAVDHSAFTSCASLNGSALKDGGDLLMS